MTQARIAAALVGGLVFWALHLNVSYFAVPWVCARQAVGVLHVLTLAAAAGAAMAAWAGWSGYRRARGADANLAAFLAVTGVALSGFFTLLILLEGLPALLQSDPCLHVPTLDRPIIFGPPPVEGGAPPAALATVWGPLMAALHDPAPIGPDAFWTAWHWDPWLLAALGLAGLAYARGVTRLWRRAGRGRGIPRWRVGAYYAGMGALVAALLSPIHAAGEALFSLHMVQHLLLMVVAAPLLVLGRPLPAYLWALPAAWRRWLTPRRRGFVALQRGWSVLTHPVSIVVLHMGALWAWHTPQLYQAALRNRWVHDLEHASFFGTALLFWWALVRTGDLRARSRYGAAILYVFATALQSGGLGALITFAPEPWYPFHETGTAAWGVDPAVDQQLAGILMWVPVGLVYTGAMAALLVAWLNEAERSASRRQRLGWEELASASPASSGSGGPPSRRGDPGGWTGADPA